MFNTNEFNEARFNSDLLSTLLEDTQLMTDDIEKLVSISFSELQILKDSGDENSGISLQLSKGFEDSLRLSEWFTIERVNPADWSDE